MSSSAVVFDRDLLRQRRNRAASQITDFDFLLQETATRLCERVDMVTRDFSHVIDLGARHGLLAKALQQNKRIGSVTTCDMAADYHPDLVVDEEFLPFEPSSVDAVVSNMALHWVNDLPGTLLQIRQALKPDGMFMAVMAGAGTLAELRQSLMQAEMEMTGGAAPRVSPFADLQTVSALMQRAGFALPVVDAEEIIVDYETPLRLLDDLRGMGATNAVHARSRKPLRRDVLMEAMRLYQEAFVQKDGRVPATIQLIFMIGWAPDASQPKPLKRGTGKHSLIDVLQ